MRFLTNSAKTPLYLHSMWLSQVVGPGFEHLLRHMFFCNKRVAKKSRCLAGVLFSLIFALCFCKTDICYNFDINKKRFNLSIPERKDIPLLSRMSKVFPSELVPETTFVEV